MTSGRIFISYSTADREIADAVREHLEDAGREVWIAPRDVPAGLSYPQAIICAIRESAEGLLVLTGQSNCSPHVLREVERLSSEKKPLYVLRAEPVTLSDGLSYFASLLQWIECTSEELLADPTRALASIVSPAIPTATATPHATTQPPPPPTLLTTPPPTSLDPGRAASDVNFSALADTKRRMLSTFGVAVLDYICQRSDPAEPIPRREILAQLTEASPGVFDGLSRRQFESLLDDARKSGCAPGLSETVDGVFVIEENIAIKRERNRVSKALIARHAAKLVTDGAVVGVDGGSTTLPIVQNILAAVEAGDLEDVTIVTNSLTSAQVVSEFMSSQGWTDDTALVSLYLVGGVVRPNTHATTWGDNVEREVSELLDELHGGDKPMTLGFIGGNGFDLADGITMGSSAELGFKRFVLEHSSQAFVVADSSKAGISLPVRIADWNEPITLLTNVLPPDVLTRLDELVLSGVISEVRE